MATLGMRSDTASLERDKSLRGKNEWQKRTKKTSEGRKVVHYSVSEQSNKLRESALFINTIMIQQQLKRSK